MAVDKKVGLDKLLENAEVFRGWEDNYKAHELREGYDTYRGLSKKSFEKKGNIYLIDCGRYYKNYVSLYLENGKMCGSCDCYDYKWNKTCEHIVAAFYQATLGPYKNTVDRSIKIKPFSRLSAEEYQYFELAKITDEVKITETVLEKAKKMLGAGRLKKFNAEISFYREGYEGQVKKGLSVNLGIQEENSEEISSVEILTTRNDMWQIDCHCRRCYYSYNMNLRDNGVICEHAMAGLLTLDEYIKQENPGDDTDNLAMKLIGHFVRQGNAKQEKIENVFLEPELQNDDGELKIGFKVGIEKAYKVKNLTDLVNTVKENGTLTLGKKGAINFSLNTFDAKSARFYNFIEKIIEDNDRRNERIEARLSWGYSSRIMTERYSDTIPLEGSAIDEIYQLCDSLEMSEIQYAHKDYYAGTTKGKLTFKEGIPKVDLVLKELKDGSRLTGVTLEGKLPELTRGAKNVYFTDSQYFYISSEEEYAQLKTLLDLSNSHGELRFNIGRRYLGEFYHNVYPVLQEFANITDRTTDKVGKIIPPVPEFTFYLDSIDNVLSCRAQVKYADKEHSVLEAIGRSGFSEVYRDFGKESEACELVRNYFPMIDEIQQEAFCDDTDSSYLVYRNGLDELMQLGEVQCTDRFQNRKVRNNFGLKIGISVESDLLNLDINSNDISKEELVALFESYRLKKKYHVLKNGDFIDLESNDMELLNQILTCSRTQIKDLLGDKIQIPLFRALYLDRLLEENEDLYSHRDRNYRKIIKDFGTVKDSDLEIPDSLDNVLRSYQEYGHKWLRTLIANNFGGILADEMGLGKTLQMISVLLAEKKQQESIEALVVCPASLVYNWEAEFARFAPELKVEVVAQGARERHTQIKGYKEVDVLITSYDLLKKDIAEYENCKFGFQVIDEAQYIKNSKTAAAKAVKAIKAEHKIALTGTPIENRLSELWSIFDFLMPGFLYDYETFKREFEAPIAKDKDEVASARLKKMVAPFILRRLKVDVLKDLPDKTEEIRYAVMEEEQQKLYDAQVLRISKKLADESDADFKKAKLQILAELTRTRQICCDPSLAVEKYSGGSAKKEACLELVQSAIEGEHRMLIFSQFTSMLDLLAADLKQNDIPYYMLTGDTPKEERMRLMKNFNEGDVPVFLISLKAGGTGLNLTGADIVIHYDPWWNLAVQNQATDRAHRIGQSKKVTVYKMIVKGSIEEKIVKLQESKKDLADEILNGENGTLGSLSREDLLELLG